MPDVSLKDLYGTVNVAGSAIVEKTHYPLPSLTDVKNSLIEYIALPLGKKDRNIK